MTTLAQQLAVATYQAQQSQYYQDRFGIISVLSYANGETINDGVTDATTAIKAAIADADEKSIIFFPPGTYLITSTITITKHLKFVSSYHVDEEVQTIIKYTGTGYVFSSGTTVNILSVVFENFIFDGVDNTPSGMFLCSQRMEIAECTFKNFSTAIGLSTVDGNVVENRIRNCNFYSNVIGISATNGASGNNTDGWITDCIFKGSTSYDIYIEQCAGWLVQGNHFYSSSATTNVWMQGYFVRFIGNYLENSVKQVYLKINSNIGTCIITSNLFMLNGDNRISLEIDTTVDTYGIVATGNAFYNVDNTPSSVIGINLVNTTYKIYGYFDANEFQNYSENIHVDAAFAGNTKYMQMSSDRLETSMKWIRFLCNSNDLDIGFYYGNPDGALTKSAGSLCVDYQNFNLYMNRDGVTDWRLIPRFSIFITDAAAMPTTGSYTKGDFIHNSNVSQLGSGGSKYVVLGWKRITTGSGNVLNTDWVEARCLTGN